MAMFSNNIILAQHKEPAFSRPLIRFVNPQTDSLLLDTEEQIVGGRLVADEIIEIAKLAQIVDERDGKMLYRKLLRAKEKAVAVICDAVDDEPYVSSRIVPLIQLSKEAIGGLELCVKVSGAKDIFVMAYKMITDIHTKIPKNIGGIKITMLRGGYPAPSLLSKIKTKQGRKLIVGAGALIHLYRAVHQRKKQSTAFITVAGNCVANPMNLEVSMGMTIMQILEKCGISSAPSRIVCGGPMTGIAIMDADKTLVTYTTRAVLAFKENIRDSYYSCIGCGRCEQGCPAGLNPMYIMRFVENSYYANLKLFDAHMCIECGTCSYVCPSKLSVSSMVKRAKQYAKEQFSTGEEGDSDEQDS